MLLNCDAIYCHCMLRELLQVSLSLLCTPWHARATLRNWAPDQHPKWAVNPLSVGGNPRSQLHRASPWTLRCGVPFPDELFLRLFLSLFGPHCTPIARQASFQVDQDMIRSLVVMPTSDRSPWLTVSSRPSLADDTWSIVSILRSDRALDSRGALVHAER